MQNVVLFGSAIGSCHFAAKGITVQSVPLLYKVTRPSQPCRVSLDEELIPDPPGRVKEAGQSGSPITSHEREELKIATQKRLIPGGQHVHTWPPICRLPMDEADVNKLLVWFDNAAFLSCLQALKECVTVMPPWSKMVESSSSGRKLDQ